MRENVDVEFKSIYVKNVKNEVAAFANTEGGVIYIGINDEGTVVGVENADETMLKVASALRDGIKPDIMPFVQIRTVTRENKQIVEIEVAVGTARPYYLSDKGLRPEGVYVRRGSACQPLSDDGIREMIMQSSGKSFEKCRSMVQNLTFEILEHEMYIRGLEIGEPQMRTLKMIGDDGLYTNLALLLSDQCAHTVKAAVFQGRDKVVFRERREFTGSLLKQLNDVYQFIDMYNKTKAVFSGLLREDKRDYPVEAIREALLNSIVHRDYSFGGSTIINIYDDRIEFSSLGGLVQGLSMEAIFMGVSQSRNSALAAVFYRMKLVESYGTGIEKIRRLYSDVKSKPEFKAAEGAFKVTLYNKNDSEKTGELKRHIYDRDSEAVYEYAKKHGKVTRKEIEELLGCQATKAYNIIKILTDKKKIVQCGEGRKRCYVPSDENA